MKRFLTTIFAVIAIPALVFGQDEVETGSKQIGLSFSTVGGAGLHYIHPISDRNNIKFTGIILYRSEDQDKETYFSLGLDYQWDLLEDEAKRIYILAGGHLNNEKSNNLYFDNYNDVERATIIGAGIGLGGDIGSTQKGLVLNAHITYQLVKGFLDIDRTRIGLGGGIGIGFNF